MNKTETLRTLPPAPAAQQYKLLRETLEELRTLPTAQAEQLAALVEPLAQALATLTDETRQTLTDTAQQLKQTQAQAEGLHQQATATLADLRRVKTPWRPLAYAILVTALLSSALASLLIPAPLAVLDSAQTARQIVAQLRAQR